MRPNSKTIDVANNEFELYTVDSYDHGVAFGEDKKSTEVPSLSLLEDTQLQAPQLRSRYVLERNQQPRQLEAQLRKLQRRGILSRSLVCFGVSSDPFYPFEGKFDASVKALELFTELTPGKLIIQTRSPLIVLAMPLLKRLGERVMVTIPLETHRQDLMDTYAPGLPRIDDRLGAIRALRACGVKVCIQAGPVLPYGDWRSDAQSFAELINDNADYIKVAPLWNGTKQQERFVRLSAVGKRLVDARQFFFLRADTAQPLIDALEKIAKNKFELPTPPAAPQQITLPFA